MNHISTLTITGQYIEHKIRQVSRENSDDVLQIVMSMMAAIDERFKAQEAAMNKVRRQLKTQKPIKDKAFEYSNLRN